MKLLYKLIRKMFPSRWHGLLTVLLYNLKIKPTINRKVKSPFSKGIIVLSADFEMAWAFRYSKTKAKIAEQMGLRERENVPKLLEFFEKYNIPVTWATVGHLFLNECSRNDQGIAHSDMPRPISFENRNWVYNSGDWYEHDPAENVTSKPAWYAPDLIKLILSSNVAHEIGCHTFSHSDFTYKNCTEEFARAEIMKCKELAKLIGIELKSMVFPGGTFGNYEVLKEQGLSCYRFPMANHIDMPIIDKYGLVAIPSSLGLDRDTNNWSASFHLQIIDSFLEKTIKNKQVCHFWFHPSMDLWYLTNVFPYILEKISKFRNNGDLEILTMASLTDKFIN